MELDSFKSKYNDFVNEFDRILANSSFDGEKLHNLTGEFLRAHKSSCLDKIPFESSPNSSFPDCNTTQICDEDLQLLDKNNLIDGGKSPISEEAQICANVYRRAAQALYLLTTLQKLRNQPDNSKERFEGLQYARYAIRYNSQDRDAVKFYSITLGWYTDTVGPGLEKARLGRLFYRSLVYNIALNPKSGLAHHLFGRYCFNVSQLSWIERTLASKLFDSSEISYTLKDAEDAFRLGHSLDDKIASTGSWMARIMQLQKKPREQIIEWIEFGLKAKTREPINDVERAQLEEFKKRGKY